MADRAPKISVFGRTSLRLTIQYSLLYSCLVIAVFLFAYLFSRYEINDWALDWMRDDVASFERVLEENGEDELINVINILTEINFESTRIYGLFDQGGISRAGSLKILPTSGSEKYALIDDLGLPPDPDGEVLGYWLRTDSIGRFKLVQGTSDHLVFELLEALTIALLIGFIALVALGLYLGSRVGRLTERRVALISSTLDQVSAGDLTSRIDIKTTAQDDLGHVERKIDEALNQIERLVATQRQISVDIAHDLRSPLQRLRQRIERLKPSGDFESEKADGLHAIDEIEQTFNALLTIAELEHENTSLEMHQIPISLLLKELDELYLESVEAAGMSLAVTSPAEEVSVIGNRSLLLQMLGNLVENSVKYCPQGTKIEVIATHDSSQVTFVVNDNGSGMSQTFRKQAFERFSREDPSRNVQGNGLGLSLVRAIAHQHSAEIDIHDNSPGVTVTISGFRLSS